MRFDGRVELAFAAEVVEWRGPAPYLFVVVPPEEAALIADLAPSVSYGWGMVPAAVAVGRTRVTTALWPRDGGYVVPLKTALRRPEGVGLGDVVEVVLTVG